MSSLPASVRAWAERGAMRSIGGLDVFVLDTGEARAAAAHAIVILHGFPTSSHDWHLALPTLARARRVVLLDVPGFGLSEKPPGYGYALQEQADIVELALRAAGATSVHVVAHDMGTTIACELLARRERGLLSFAIESVTFMNGSVHVELTRLTPSQRILLSPLARGFVKVASGTVFKAQMRRILGKPVADEELDAMWALIEHRGGKARLADTIVYARDRWRFKERWIPPLSRLDLPALVLWGPRDPVAVIAIAETLAREIPGARYERLEGLGHYPMVEDPERTAGAIERFLGSVERQSGSGSGSGGSSDQRT